MSLKATYKGGEIAALTEDGEVTLKTGGTYCEGDIVLTNTQDGGGEITDGIIVKARNADGNIIEIDYYKSDGTIPKREFASGGGDWPSYETSFGKLEKVNFKNPITAIGDRAFESYSLKELPDLSNVTTLGKGVFYKCINLTNADLPPNITELPSETFKGCTAIKIFDNSFILKMNGSVFHECKLVEVKLPRCTVWDTAPYSGVFVANGTLESVSIGSIGYPVSTKMSPTTFKSCDGESTIEIFTTGDMADAILANVRNGATNATIIIKAAEGTEYDPSSEGLPLLFKAGETIITSIPEEAEE